MKARRVVRLGVIADTHGLYDPAIERYFRSVDHIIHAGGIGEPGVLIRLSAVAPVIAVAGNVDGYEKSGFPSHRIIRLAGRRIAVRHIVFQGGRLTPEARAFLDREQPDICIFGHTHRPTVERYGGTLLFNPGSAGPKRFALPRAVGLLSISRASVRPRLISLAARPTVSRHGERRSPCEATDRPVGRRLRAVHQFNQ